MVVNASSFTGPVRSGALVGVVLAGGEGRRMGPGVSKPLRRVGGRTLIHHVIDRLRPQVMDLVVVANDPLPAYRRLGVPLISDPPEVRRSAREEGRRLGPLAGILAGMEWSLAKHPHAGWILSVPADVPFLPLDLTMRLCGLMHVPEPDVLMVLEGRRRQPALAVWSVKLVADLRQALLHEGVRKVEEFAARHRVAELAWPARSGVFFNVNTPQDLAAANARGEARAKGVPRPG
jgi:molybdopterin-guanine dinucleotide biosynthesis protein A